MGEARKAPPLSMLQESNRSQWGGEHLQNQRSSEVTSELCLISPWQGSAGGTHTQPQEVPMPLE